ncbi:MAG: hypothetical protein JWN02_939 [Acidobacteria bacterium]|nr:hypothetical protein [Acidobacteriota bacterium]
MAGAACRAAAPYTASVGVGLWTIAALAAFGMARLIPPGRELHRVAERILAFLAGAAGGLVATYLDFGGWAEADWRAGLFVFFFALATLGAARATFLLAWKKVP